MRATTVTEERRDWPVEELVSMNDQWKIGPDPRHEPDAYLEEDELEAKYAGSFPNVADTADDE